MARGLTVWLAAVAGGCVVALGLVRIWTGTLAPNTLLPTRADSAAAAYDDLAMEARRTATAIQRIRWSRAMRARAREPQPLVLGEAGVGDDAGDRVRAALDRLPTPERVAVAIVPAAWRRPEDDLPSPGPSSYGIQYLLPDEGPCQVAVSGPGGPSPGAPDFFLDPDRLLGPCWWVARYGPPSDSVRAWLRRGGGILAQQMTPTPPEPDGGARAWRNRLREACAAGNRAACARVLAQPDGWLWSRLQAAAAPPEDPLLYQVGWMRLVSSPGPFDGKGAHLLADLERELGPESFGRFWRSDGSVPDALSEALGRPVGAWLADWTAARFEVAPARAGLSAIDVLLSILTIGGFAGLGLLLGRKGRPLLRRSRRAAADAGTASPAPGRQTGNQR